MSRLCQWLPGVWLRHLVPPVWYKYRELWGLVVVWLLWLSGRALVVQARGVLGSTPCNCCPFHFPLFLPDTSKFIYWSCLFVVGNKFVNGYVHKVCVWISVGYTNVQSFKVTCNREQFMPRHPQSCYHVTKWSNISISCKIVKFWTVYIVAYISR